MTLAAAPTEPHSLPLAPPATARVPYVPLLLATFVFSSLSLLAGLSSDGFLEADACSHYQYARWCHDEPHYLINVWGRPVCTGVYALPAVHFGRTGTKILSLLLALGTAHTVYTIAKRQNYPRPALAFICLLAQPLLFLHSFSELTELPFALMLAVAFLAYRDRRWWELALVAGTMPLARPEGFGFLAMTAAALVLHKRPHWLFLLALPVTLWNWAGWELYGRPGPWYTWLRANWPYAAQSLYDAKPLYHFLLLLPMVVSPFLFPALWIGIWQSLRLLFASDTEDPSRRGQSAAPPRVPSPIRRFALSPIRFFFKSDLTTRCDLLIAILPLLILVGHSYLTWRGKMASNGELRYMLVVSPFWALLAARGFAWAFDRLNWPGVYRYAGAAALLPALANWIYPVLPLRFDPNWQHARQIAQNYLSDESLRAHYPAILSAHPGIPYFMAISPTDPKRAVEWRRESVAQRKQGVLLVWDEIYSMYNSDAARVIPLETIRANGWIPLEQQHDAYGREWQLFLSPTDAAENPTPKTE